VTGGFDPGALQRDHGDIDGEADACRSSVALFDFSFMHRARIDGRDAIDLVQRLTPRPLGGLSIGRIAYALRIDAAGHAVADLTVWRVAATTFEVFSGRADEIETLQLFAADVQATVAVLTAATSIFALQGPSCLRALATVADADALRRLSYFAHVELDLAGVACRVGRLGYTGERGFEIVAPRAGGDRLWALLAQAARPAGFAAADILRIEAGFILFANELRYPVTPAALGLGRFAPAGAERPHDVRLVCFKAECDTKPVLFRPMAGTIYPPAPGSMLITSACHSTRADGVLGLALVRPRAAGLADVSGRFRSIAEVALPYFDNAKCRPRGTWRADLWPDDGTH